MTYWRNAGLNYVSYSNIAASVLRRSLKPTEKAEALKRGEPNVKLYYWLRGEMLPQGQRLEVVKETTKAA